MFYVYILRMSNGNHYIGQTNNVASRLLRHQTGQVRSTKGHRPVQLLHIENFASRQASMNREKYLKSLKSRKAIKMIIQSGDGPIV